MRRRHLILLLSASLTWTTTAYAQDGESGTSAADKGDEATPAEARAAEVEDGEDSSVPGLAAKVPAKRAKSERLAGEAEEAFGAGEYERAIDLLQQAYDSDQNPNMLYNIARVHEEQGQLEEALEFYRRFVVAPSVDLDYRREALQSSETIEQTLAARADADRAAEQEATAVAEDPAATVMLRPAPFPTTSSMRPLGYVLAGIGGTAVLAGAAFGVAALQKESQFDDAGSLAERRAAGSSARDLATAADALYISGTVLVVTGLVTAFASPRRERPQALQAFDVTVRNDGVGAAWTLRF